MSNLASEGLPAEDKKSSVQKELSDVGNLHNSTSHTPIVSPFVGIRKYTNQLSPKLATTGYIKRSRQIYERLYSELVKHYPGSYVAIEPDSGDYFLNANKVLAQKEAKEKYPARLICTFQVILKEHRKKID
ncbi:hypothetical protein H6G80_15750 [Nostoc sp. FACHB-87]|uniref:hypothetical protein n=1 Tax=Nostocaceae TaxID=1162 RepID=UPI001681C3CE|nr:MULTISPECIES: hypothetical protein [Nostocaceae]MBD2455529.1 hypothetical protein [Nostoc sp. FACHB-87]MBD2478578.1 hypothetical protein [Anabaena sp. FACHB-83]